MSPAPPPPPSSPTPPDPPRRPAQQPPAASPARPPAAPFTLDPASIELALTTLQQRIDLLQANLTQQNKLSTLGMVTAVIAHEFNNILTPMISYTTFALSDKADEALRTKALTKALSGAERMANISKSLLGFARGDESTRAHVATVIKETLACLSRELSKDGITLTMDVPDDLAVAMNAGQLQQVLMNLVVNARSAMLTGQIAAAGDLAPISSERPAAAPLNSPVGGRRAAIEATRRRPPGAPRLATRISDVAGPDLSVALPHSAHRAGGIKRLTIRATAVENQRVIIEVADTGPGIPPEVLPRIFEPFFSTKRGAHAAAAEETEDVPRGGTGLGLTICNELVTAAGGTIRVESAVGAGATFRIELPRQCTREDGKSESVH